MTQDILDAVRKGDSIPGIAKKYGVTDEYVYTLCARYQIEWSDKQEKLPSTKPTIPQKHQRIRAKNKERSWSARETYKLREMAADPGMRLQDAAAILHRSVSSVWTKTCRENIVWVRGNKKTSYDRIRLRSDVASRLTRSSRAKGMSLDEYVTWLLEKHS